jgi:fumarate reductase subunit C
VSDPRAAESSALGDPRAATWRFLLQRGSAAVLAACVLVHLAAIIYATRHGLTSSAIIARMHSSIAWPAFYLVFVVAVAVHAPLGLRVIADEWLGWRGRGADRALAAFALLLLAGGIYAVGSLAFG